MNMVHPPSRGGRKRGGGKQTKAKKASEALPVESTVIMSYFAKIGLDVEKPTTEGKPPMKKKKARSKKRMVYNIVVPVKLLLTWHQCISWRRCKSVGRRYGVF